MLLLQLLGSPQIVLHGKNVRELRSVKSLALLYYLGMSDRPQSRLTLAGLLWPEKGDREARVNLRQALRRLRVVLGDYLLTTRETVGFNLALPHEVDAKTFEAKALVGLSGDVEALQDAADHYTGEFLQTFYVDDAHDFELWMLVERERLHGLALQVMRQLSSYYAEGPDVAQALQITRRLLALEPWHEETYRRMMRLLARDGQVGAALVQYETCRQILAAELDMEPAAETTRLYEQIRAGKLTASRPVAPAELHLQIARPAHNLPRQFTSFIGRESEIEQLDDWLADPACALVTIRGPGGIGKTRLAIEVARRCLDGYADGAWFVDLAPVSRIENFFTAIATGLGLDLSGRIDVRRQVLNYLENKRLLLIIDNFEHLMAGVDELMEILQRAAGIQVIVTSHESLNLQAEWVFEAQGLATPEPGPVHRAPPTAVVLFVQRLRQWRPNIALAPADYEIIGQICRLVAGMPLAIELAASLARTHSYDEIAQAIERDLDMLATKMHDVPARQRSLRAVFDYSWQLLSRQEQETLAQLSVFRGGFTTVAAAAVASANDKLLNSLQDKSFLSQPVSGRYEMHEIIRQYASEKMATWEIGQQVADRHSAYYLDFVAEREQDLMGSEAPLALAEIRNDLANVWTAWLRVAEDSNLQALDRSRLGLVRFCARSGLLQEGEWLFGLAAHRLQESMVAGDQPAKEMHQILGRMLAEQANFLDMLARYDRAVLAAQAAMVQAQGAHDAYGAARGAFILSSALAHQGAYEDARTQLKQTLNLARTAQLKQLEAGILSTLGIIDIHMGELCSAQALLEEAVGLCREIGDLEGEGAVVNNLAIVHTRRGDFGQARICYKRALDIYREMGELDGESLALANLGIVARHQGDFSQATRVAGRSLEISRQIGVRWLECGLLNTLGIIQLRQGVYGDAKTYLNQALRLSREIGYQYAESEALASLGLLANQEGKNDEALFLCQEALQLSLELGDPMLAGYAWMGVGRSLEDLGRPVEAANAFDQALKTRQGVGPCGLAAEARAGLARVALTGEAMTQAQEHVEHILSCVESGAGPPNERLDGTEEPVRIYLTCYKVLDLLQDERAPKVLDSAYAILQARAEKITDLTMRRSFLENVATHRFLAK